MAAANWNSSIAAAPQARRPALAGPNLSMHSSSIFGRGSCRNATFLPIPQESLWWRTEGTAEATWLPTPTPT